MSGRAPTIVALIASFNEADVIGQVIGDLIRQGVQVYLIDHGSTDGTVTEAASFLGRGLIQIERFPVESGPEGQASFAWAALLRRKEALASELDADWFVHADADELRESPFGGMTFGDAIRCVDSLGYNAIEFQVFNFPPTHNEFAPGDDLRRSFRDYEEAGPFDRLQIKGWKKLGAPVDLASSGGHEAAFAGRRIFPIRFPLLHYPIRSQAHGERKVFEERRPRFLPEERERGWHVQYDAIEPGHSFVRRADELERFDLETVRVELALGHRGVEALQARLAKSEEERGAATQAAERASGELASIYAEQDERVRQLAELFAERERREVAVGALERLVESLRAEVEALRAEVEARRLERDRFATEATRLYEERVARERQLGELDQRFERLRGQGEELRVERDRYASQAGRLYEERVVREGEIARLQDLLVEREQAARAAIDERTRELRDAQRDLGVAESELDRLYASRSWRWAAPARLVHRLLK